MTVFLNLLVGTLLANILSSSNVKPPVSGSRKKVQMVQRTLVPNHQKADLGPQFQAVALNMRGVILPLMIPPTT
jgi:hypothetical protein